jgi:hypothetical protein
MSDEPSLKALLGRAWQLRVESTQVKFAIAQAIAEAICRKAAAMRRYFSR